MDELWNTFLDGGVVTAAITLCLILEIGIIIERSLYFRSTGMKAQPFLTAVRAKVLAGRLDEAIELSSARPRAALARVVKAGLMRVKQPLEHIRAAVHETASEELPRLTRRVPALMGLGMLAMLLGMYGTLMTHLESFRGYGWDPRPVSVRVISHLSGSLGPAVFGMAVAVVALVGRALVHAWRGKLEAQIHHGAAMVLNLIREAKRGD